MSLAIRTIFYLELALLFVHEMDAIRKQEWRMFIILKDMENEKAYHMFLLLHIPLYLAIFALLFSSLSHLAYYIIDVFLLTHALIHFGFSTHPNNRLNGAVSKMLINLAGLLALIHLFAASTK